LQIKEFRILGLSINDSVYSCLFFFLTGLHFFHLLLGLLLLSLLFWSHSFGFNLGNQDSKKSSSCNQKQFSFLSRSLSLGAAFAIFSGIILNGEKIVGISGSKNLLPSSSCTLSLYHLVSTFIGILLTFSPMHFLGFNVMPRRIPQFPDSFHSWNFLSSIGSGITFLSFAIFFKVEHEWNVVTGGKDFCCC